MAVDQVSMASFLIFFFLKIFFFFLVPLSTSDISEREGEEYREKREENKKTWLREGRKKKATFHCSTGLFPYKA